MDCVRGWSCSRRAVDESLVTRATPDCSLADDTTAAEAAKGRAERRQRSTDRPVHGDVSVELSGVSTHFNHVPASIMINRICAV